MLLSHLTVSPTHGAFIASNDPSTRSRSGLPCRRHAFTASFDHFPTWSLLHVQDLDLGFVSGASLTLHMQPIAALNSAEFRRLRTLESTEKAEEDDDDLCPVECVKEFKTRTELAEILEISRKSDTLVVVDFYKTACGSCKYIEQGFIKLCKGAGDDEAAVIFLKHNVMDEYEEQSEVAEELKIKVVPLFHFYKDGQLVESFPTREKSKILETIKKYLSSFPNESKVVT